MMAVWMGALTLLAAVLGAISHVWFRRDQFDKTTEVKTFKERVQRAIQWRADTRLRRDLELLRRWTGIALLTALAPILMWPILAPRGFGIPPTFDVLFLGLLSAWTSFHFALRPGLFFRKFVYPFILFATAAPWLLLGVNWLQLERWTLSPFDALLHIGPLAPFFPVSDSPFLLAAKASALYLTIGIVLTVIYAVLFSLLPIIYLAVAAPPTWSARWWVAMTEHQKHNRMLTFDILAKVVIPVILGVCALCYAVVPIV